MGAHTRGFESLRGIARLIRQLHGIRTRDSAPPSTGLIQSSVEDGRTLKRGMKPMDMEKLKRLRARYADRGAFDGDDPVLLRAARDVQTGDGRRSLPYSGVPTFLGLPHATSLDGLDIAVVGVPMDLGVSNRAGARFGPRAVRTIERIGPYHPTFRGVPKGRARAADVGDVGFRSRYDLVQSLRDIEEYYLALRARGVRPLSVGGDHSITYPIL